MGWAKETDPEIGLGELGEQIPSDELVARIRQVYPHLPKEYRELVDDRKHWFVLGFVRESDFLEWLDAIEFEEGVWRFRFHLYWVLEKLKHYGVFDESETIPPP